MQKTSGRPTANRHDEFEKPQLVSHGPDGTRDSGYEIHGASEWIANGSEATSEMNPSARSEQLHFEFVKVVPMRKFWIGGEQDLKTSIQAESVDDVGANPSPDSVAGFQDNHVRSRCLEDSGTCQSGKTGPHDDNFMIHWWSI
jgi:hypothetical protein